MWLILALLLVPTSLHAWLSPGEKAHKAEFWEAWEQRFGPIPSNSPPIAMLKTWFRQWKKTKVAAGAWLDANVGHAPGAGPPSGGAPGGGVPGGGVPGGTNL